MLHQIRTFSGQLDRHKQDIVHALDALDRLSRSLNRQRDTIDATLDELPGALRSINTQRARPGPDAEGAGPPQRCRHPGDQAVEGLDDRHPAPAQPGAEPAPGLRADDFVNAFNVALTYPFVDEVVGRDPQVARNLQMGDYTNLVDQARPLARPERQPADRCRPGCRRSDAADRLPTSLPTSEITKILGDVAKCLQSGDITSKACQKVLGDPQELAPADRQVQEEEAPRQPGLPGAQRAARACRPGHRSAVAEPPDQPAARRPAAVAGVGARPVGVRAARADDAAAVADVRPGPGRLLVPGMVMGR